MREDLLQSNKKYRQYFLNSDTKRARFGIALLSIPIMIYSFNDFTLFGFSSGFDMLITLRLAILALTIFIFLYLGKIKDYNTYYKAITSWELILVISVAVINLTRPINFVPDQTIIAVIFIFTIFLVIPNYLRYQTVLAMIIALSIVFTAFFNANPISLTACISLFVAYVIAFTISWQLEVYRKNSYKDLLNREKAEQALKVSEERFRSLVESTSDWIWQVNQQSQYTYVSPKIKEILGYSPEEILGKTPFDLMPEEEGKKISEKFRKILENEMPFFGLENVNIHKNGKRVLLESSGVPIKNEKGNIIGYRGIDRDITQRKNAEEQLAKSRIKLQEYTTNLEALVEERTKQLQNSERLAAIGQTAGMIGHDIRNPLQAIVSELYMAKEIMKEVPTTAGIKDAFESINFIERQVEYISKIVSDLQDYARPLKPEMVNLNLCTFIRDALQDVEIPENIQTKLFCENKDLAVTLDRTFMKRALTNLATNAIQAMPNGGKLIVRTVEESGKAKISVEDTGVGIPEEIKSKLFMPLFTTKAKGQGFGLAVVKRLIDIQGGSISFESVEGEGTTFTIYLPLQK